jgi:phytoene/squalene synthetase
MLPPPADDFEVELSRWGPESPSAPPSLADSRAYCRFLATGHYENFPVVSLLLPKPLHQHFYNVYAYCRWSDDLGDETGDPQRALALLGWWRGELEACYAGQARHPVFVALAETIREFDIPRQPLTDLLSAFEQDQTVREYDTYPQLLDYCRRSADPVGRLVLALCRKATSWPISGRMWPATSTWAAFTSPGKIGSGSATRGTSSTVARPTLNSWS